MDKQIENTIMDQFLNEILKKAIKRLEQVKPWEEKKNQIATMDKHQAANYLGVSTSTINTLLTRNRIPCVRPTGDGGMVLFRKKTLDKWMTELEKESVKDIDDLAKELSDPNEFKVS